MPLSTVWTGAGAGASATGAGVGTVSAVDVGATIGAGAASTGVRSATLLAGAGLAVASGLAVRAAARSRTGFGAASSATGAVSVSAGAAITGRGGVGCTTGACGLNTGVWADAAGAAGATAGGVWATTGAAASGVPGATAGGVGALGCITGAGGVTAGGAVIWGCASCAKAGVEPKARTAAIAAKAGRVGVRCFVIAMQATFVVYNWVPAKAVNRDEPFRLIGGAKIHSYNYVDRVFPAPAILLSGSRNSSDVQENGAEILYGFLKTSGIFGCRAFICNSCCETRFLLHSSTPIATSIRLNRISTVSAKIMRKSNRTAAPARVRL